MVTLLQHLTCDEAGVDRMHPMRMHKQLFQLVTQPPPPRKIPYYYLVLKTSHSYCNYGGLQWVIDFVNELHSYHIVALIHIYLMAHSLRAPSPQHYCH